MDGLAGPLAIWDIERLESLVFCGRIREPGGDMSICTTSSRKMRVSRDDSHRHDCDVGAMASWFREVDWVFRKQKVRSELGLI